MFYRDFQLLRKVSNTGANALRQIRKTFRERNSRPRAKDNVINPNQKGIWLSCLNWGDSITPIKLTYIKIPFTKKTIMRGTNILLFIIALVLSLFLGLQIEEQYRDVRYLNNCKKDIKANGIQTNDVTAYCAGLVRQDPYLFTYNRGNVGKYLRERTSEAPKKTVPKSEPKK